MPHVSLKERFKKLNIEVELGFTAEQVAQEVQRCLNCDVQTVFEAKLCIECDACIDICPVDCLTITAQRRGSRAARAPEGAGEEPRRRRCTCPRRCRRPARVMVKDEDLCVHCGLCAERCPTAAWDMQKSTDPLAARRGRSRCDAAKPPKTQPRRSHEPRKRLRHQDRDRQRHRLGQRQHAADEVHLPQRHPGDGQELLPVQHPGPAHLVRDPRDPGRLRRPLRPASTSWWP